MILLIYINSALFLLQVSYVSCRNQVDLSSQTVVPMCNPANHKMNAAAAPAAAAAAATAAAAAAAVVFITVYA